MTNLFQQGEFTSHAGVALDWKVECDALTDEDIECIASYVASKHDFSRVVGVPTGGDRLAEALKKYRNVSSKNLLIVDDVLTTGKSVEESRAYHAYQHTIGFVIFDRSGGKRPDWIDCMWELKV